MKNKILPGKFNIFHFTVKQFAHNIQVSFFQTFYGGCQIGMCFTMNSNLKKQRSQTAIWTEILTPFRAQSNPDIIDCVVLLGKWAMQSCAPNRLITYCSFRLKLELLRVAIAGLMLCLVVLYVMCTCIQETDCPVIQFFCNRVN